MYIVIYIYIYSDIIQVIHLHIFAYTLKFTLAESPRHSTCEATHPSVGHGVDGAAWFPVNISSGTLQCLRFELTEADQSKHRALEHLTASDCIWATLPAFAWISAYLFWWSPTKALASCHGILIEISCDLSQRSHCCSVSPEKEHERSKRKRLFRLSEPLLLFCVDIRIALLQLLDIWYFHRPIKRTASNVCNAAMRTFSQQRIACSRNVNSSSGVGPLCCCPQHHDMLRWFQQFAQKLHVLPGSTQISLERSCAPQLSCHFFRWRE